jgi:hypothetical protein
MRLQNLQDTRDGAYRTVSMDLVWEDSPRPAQSLYFSVHGNAGDSLNPTPDAFAIACLPLALWFRERRLSIDGSLCPRLAGGLRAVNGIFADWYGNLAEISIEASGGFIPRWPPATGRTVSLLSGGVDGLYALRRNRLNYPLDHPSSISACITLFGGNTFDVDEQGPVPERLTAFVSLVQRLSALAEQERFELIPVLTNIRSLGLDYRAATKIGIGAGHIAVAQLFQGRFHQALFASDGDGPNPFPGASHPLLMPHFSTDALLVQGTENEVPRSEKIRSLADWEPGRRLMQPCHYVTIPAEGRINCCRCEKCIRTMLVLIGLNRLQDVGAFVEKDVTPDMIQAIPIATLNKADLLMQSIPLLAAVGRDDLIRAIRRRVLRFEFNNWSRRLLPRSS